MPESFALMGLGMNPNLASRLGNDPLTLAAAGSNSQTNASTIKTHLTKLTTAGGADSAKFSTDAPVGTPFYVANASATTAIVFVGLGDSLNGSANGSLSIAQNKAAIFIQVAEGIWFSILTA